jgi:hypothetical protein
VYIPPGTKQSPYGFTDQIGKTGHLLFSSILFVEACACMAELYAKTGDDERRRGWDDERIRVTDAIEMLWSDEEDMYFAADKDCRQYDVWGSAYMAYTGICSRQKTLRIGQRLVRDYDRIIQNGQVRHLFYPEYWNNKIGVRHQVTNLPKEGTYQNGAYWGIASGWVAGAMDLVADGSGRRLLGELVRYYQHAGIFEAVNTETGYFGAKDYCSSVTLVIKELRRMGLDI